MLERFGKRSCQLMGIDLPFIPFFTMLAAMFICNSSAEEGMAIDVVPPIEESILYFLFQG